MQEILIFEPDDTFLKDAINKLSEEEVELLVYGIHENFKQVHKEGILISKDLKNSLELYLGLCKLIRDNLFNETDISGYYKAKAFWDKYKFGVKTIKEVLFHYLKLKWPNSDYKTPSLDKQPTHDGCADNTFKPLCTGELNDLKDKIYKEQFFDYDETIDAEKVLDELQNLKNNPKLLDYVIKCLAKVNIDTVPDKFYCVVVNAELRMEYNEKIHGTFEKYKQHCVDGDFGLKKRDHLLTKVYNSFGDIENEMMNSEGEEIFGFGHTKNQKYTIHELG